jgi:transcriptional regulator NrdR family protein
VGPCHPEHHQEKVADAQPAPGGGSRRREGRCNTRSTFETFRYNLVTYVRRQMKHLKNSYETLAKTFKKHLKPLQKHTQHSDNTLANIICETYATSCKIRKNI